MRINISTNGWVLLYLLEEGSAEMDAVKILKAAPGQLCVAGPCCAHRMATDTESALPCTVTMCYCATVAGLSNSKTATIKQVSCCIAIVHRTSLTSKQPCFFFLK